MVSVQCYRYMEH